LGVSDYLDEIPNERIDLADVKTVQQFLWPFVAKYRGKVTLIVGLIAVNTVFNIAFPVASRWLIDDGLIARNAAVVMGVLAYLAVALTIGSAAWVAYRYLDAGVISDIIRDIRQAVFDHLQTLSFETSQKIETGQTLTRFSGDVAATEGLLVAFAGWFLLPLIQVVYTTALMFWFNAFLAMLACSIFPLVLIVPKIFANRAFALSYDKRAKEGRLLGAVHENALAQNVIKAMQLERFARARFWQLNSDWRSVAFRLHFAAALVEASAEYGLWAVHILVLGFGAYWIFSGNLTVGTLVAFEAMFVSMGYALTYVAQFVPTLAEAAGSIRHVEELMTIAPEPADPPDAITLPHLSNEIVFRDVEFRYPGDRFRMTKFSLTIRKGSYTAVVGASGSGKSTLISLLLRLYEPDEGQILLDGQDVRGATRASLWKQIGVIFQETFLFDASVSENIAVGAPGADFAQIRAAAKAAEADEFIRALPQGYNIPRLIDKTKKWVARRLVMDSFFRA
jgi:ATP-binding cassette subfamily B protein